MAKQPTAATASRTQGFSQNWSFGDTGSLVPQLCLPRDYHLLRQMVEEDETIGAMLFCITSSVAQVTWKHVPCVDGVPAEGNAKAKKSALFADSLMSDMTHSWSDHLDDALTMVWAGFAPCEIVTRQRLPETGSRYNDGFYGIKHVPLRAQNSITRWVYDESMQELRGLQQMIVSSASTAGGEDPAGFIPIWKMCLYRTNASMNRPQGRSLLANIYRAWRLKKRIQDSEAIGIDRDMAGLPIGRVPNDVLEAANEVDDDGKPTPEAAVARGKIQTMINAVSTLRYNEKGGLILPSNPWAEEEPGSGTSPQWDFKIMTSAGQRSIDTRTAIRDYDRAIARGAMMQFLHLGDRAGGSYGLSDDQSTMAMRSLMFLIDKIATAWTDSALDLVWAVNGFNPKYKPRLKANELSKEDLAKAAAMLTAVRKSADMFEDDPDARVEALKLAGIRVTRASQEKPLPVAPAATPGGDDPAPTSEPK